MASSLLRVYGTITRCLKNGVIGNNAIRSVTTGGSNVFQINTPLVHHVRNTSFFNKRSAEQLWKGVTSVSNAGKRRGRAKGRMLIKNLNRGQVIGVGKVNIQWPGLTAPIFRGREIVKQQKLPEDSERDAKLIKLRESMSRFRRLKLTPLERGWSGGKLGGRKLGPPDPVGEETFEGFESWILECKTVSTMTGNLGRKKRASSVVVTGNQNGLAGFALGKKPEVKSALKTAKNRAAQKLMYIPRYKEHTVLHDFFTKYGKTKIYVSKKYEGYGLKCHRVINACCQAIGIKDLYAKVEGSMNTQAIMKAFFLGLLKQKSYQEIADDKKLHLVEMRKENNYFPEVVASPSEVRKPNEISSNETVDFKQYIMDGKIILKKKKIDPFYTKHKSWKIRQRKQEYLRGQDDVRIRLYAEHGELRSFLTDKYPEAKPQLWRKPDASVE